MLEISIDKSVSKAILNFMQNGNKDVERAILNGVTKSGLMLQNRAKELAPVKRGALRRSINGKLASTSYIVGTNLPYAKIQEFGGVIRPKKSNFLRWNDGGTWHAARSVAIKPYKGGGYFRPALQFVSKQIGGIISKEIVKALKI